MVALLGVMIASASFAGDYSVAPVRVFMSPRDKLATLTVTNRGNEAVVLQFRSFQWRQQPDGFDELNPTGEVTLTPPIMRVEPQASRIVRLYHSGQAVADQEQTYRLIVSEIREARGRQLKEGEIDIGIDYSIPVFVIPPGLKHGLSCRPRRSASDKIVVRCENTSAAHALVRGFVLFGAANERLAARDAGAYLLPKVVRDFELESKGASVRAGEPVRLQAIVDDDVSELFKGALQ